MTPTRLVVFAVLTPALFLAVFLALNSGSSDDRHLSEASRLMAKVSFVSRPTVCPDCPAINNHSVYEYAPPDRLRVSDYDQYEAWQYYLYADRTAYASGNGTRWIEGLGLPVLGFLLSDPRVLLASITDAGLEREDDIEGNPVRIYRGNLDFDAYFERLPVDMDAELSATIRDNYGPLVDGSTVELWIDAGDYRVLRSGLHASDAARKANPDIPDQFFQRDYVIQDVTIPDTIESMDAEEAERLARLGEPVGTRLLIAATEYWRRNGVYPARLDEATLAGIYPGAWPSNAFTNQPIRDSSEAGDFTYVLKNDGRDFEFTLHGWHIEQQFFDTVRFGTFQGQERPPP